MRCFLLLVLCIVLWFTLGTVSGSLVAASVDSSKTGSLRSTPHPVSETSALQEALKVAAQYKASDVIFGFEFKAIKQAGIQALDISTIGGVYRTELGGVDIEVRIKKSGTTWHVQRCYHEPGLITFEKSYITSLTKGALVDKHQSVWLYQAKGGIVLLELNPESDALPIGFWMYYDKVSP